MKPARYLRTFEGHNYVLASYMAEQMQYVIEQTEKDYAQKLIDASRKRKAAKALENA